MSEPVVVVGAGIAGLVAAFRLVQQGRSVIVLESSDRPGGVIRSSTREGFLREHAANGFLSGAEDGALDLAVELGVDTIAAAPEAKRRWIYVDDALHSLPTNPMEAVTADILSWKAKLRMLGEPIRPRGAGEETVDQWARRRLGDEAARKLMAPFVTGVFGGDAAELSLPAAFPKLAALEEEGGLVRGMLGRMLAGRRNRAKSKRERPRIHAPAGGVEALVRALADHLGAALRFSVPAVAIDNHQGRPRVRTKQGETISASAVVLATPAHVSARLLANSSAQLAAVLDEIPYAPICVVHLGYKRTDISHALDGFGFLVVAGEPVRMLGTVFESVLWPNRASDGNVLLRCIFAGSRDPSAARIGDEDLVELARRDLHRVLGLQRKPIHAHVSRWPRAIAQYTLGHLDRVARAEGLARDLGVVLAGSAYHGPAVNSCVADGRRVAQEVAALS